MKSFIALSINGVKSLGPWLEYHSNSLLSICNSSRAHVSLSLKDFFGNDDENPSPEDFDDYSKALNKGGVEHHFYRYDNAGHAFQSFNSEDKFRSEASEDAWVKVLDFFQEKL